MSRTTPASRPAWSIPHGRSVGPSDWPSRARSTSASHVAHRIHTGANRASALVSGYHYGLAIAAGLALLTAMLVFLAPAARPTAEQVAAATA